ncbi:head-tail connector protein [Pararhizobium sp. LjRoot238]|uniref:head-tail connector protein n=1 Tax=Pararhizobium sp. LjRoot238 TaxID=3342293 RepID=UPI003ECEBDA4
MWYPAKVTAAPATEPVTLTQVKQQCQISSADNSRNDQIDMLIKAERAFVETYCNIRLVEQTVEMKCDCFADFDRLHVAPVQSVGAIAYVDVTGAAQTLSSSVYEFRGEGDNLSPAIVLAHAQVWPSILAGTRITVTATVGFGDVPPDVVAAILMRIGNKMAFSRDDVFKRSEEVEGVGTVQWAGAIEVSEAIDTTTRVLLENYRTWPLA